MVEREISDALGGQAVMSEDDVIGYLEDLACKRPVFHSEVDFQHALAWHIHEAMPCSDVRLEFKPFLCQKLYLDICLPDVGVAIELKYKTRKAELKHDGEFFQLLDHSAFDCGRYDFIQDVGRLERAVDDGAVPAKVGFAVFLTNEPHYWKYPRFLTKSGYGKPNDCAFRIHDRRTLCGKLDWLRRPKETDPRKCPIPLRGTYPVTWREYSSPGNGEAGSFRYLLVQVRQRHES